MKELENLIKCKETKAKVIHISVFPTIMYRCKSWIVKKDPIVVESVWYKVLEGSFMDTMDCQKDEYMGLR